MGLRFRRRGLGAGGFALLGVWITMLMGAGAHRTANFQVDAPTPTIARQVAEKAEECRRTIAERWLGRELPTWKKPCTVRVKVTQGEAGGLTSFTFGLSRVTGREMSVEGRLERILASAIPHEVTHTVFADFFGGPMPRWADEGASLLSEDDYELKRHEDIAGRIIQGRRNAPLKQLFQQEEYPRNLLDFYGQGYSVSRFLVDIGGRTRFLQFVRTGMKQDWDRAVREVYGFPNVRELDRAWQSWYQVTRAAGGDSGRRNRTVDDAAVVSGMRSTAPVTIRAQSPTVRR